MPTTRRQRSRRLTLQNLKLQLEALNQHEIQQFWNHKFVIRQFLLTNTIHTAWSPPRLQLFKHLLQTFVTIINHTIAALQRFRTNIQSTIDILENNVSEGPTVK